ncbi:MAG: MmgE/PrpD family protein [Hyphomicrobiaceae bacterium]
MSGETMTIAARLADKIVGFKTEQVTPRALTWAKAAIIDTIGVTLAGVVEPCATILMETPGVADAPGPSLIFGTERRTSMLDATLINGTASHALDYDDVNGTMGGHPSVPLLPPLFALSEMKGASGMDLITAFVIGYEVEVRLARGVHMHHYNKGWHPTATLGTFGAAAAACRLMGLDADKTTRAIAIAASLASGLKANFGTMTKPLHVGHCARNGLFAALIAAKGFQSNPAAFEHKQGFLDVFNGKGTYDAERIFAGWGAPLEIEDTLNGLKQFPCCGSTHPAIAMMLKLVKEEGLKPEDAQKVEILTHPNRLPHTDNPDPKGPLGAKFSIQYAVARALADGAVRLAHFEGDAHADPRVRKVMAVTTAGPHPEMPADARHQWGAEVIVTTTGGKTVSRRIENMVCRGPDDAMSSEEMFEKFEDCAGRSLAHDQIAPLYERLDTFECVNDMNQVSRLLQLRRLPGQRVAKPQLTSASDAAAGRRETQWVP